MGWPRTRPSLAYVGFMAANLTKNIIPVQIFMNFFSLLTQNCVTKVAVCAHSTQFHQGRDDFRTRINIFLIVLQWRCNDRRDGRKEQRWLWAHLQQLTHQAWPLLTIINTRAAGAEMTFMPSVMVGKTGAATWRLAERTFSAACITLYHIHLYFHHQQSRPRRRREPKDGSQSHLYHTAEGKGDVEG